MSVQGKIKRLYLIIEKIGKSTYAPNFEEVKEFLEDEGFQNLSERTLQRDLEALRWEFGIKIVCDRQNNNVYKIDYENSLEINSFLQILNTAITADILLESIKDYSKMIDYIQVGADSTFKGVSKLRELLFAVKNKREISFNYLPFYKEKPKQHILEPYLLKEYLNRWYIIGVDKAVNEFRTYGIDRLDDLKILTQSFERDEKIDPKELFEHTIGLNYNYSGIERVVLSFTPFQANYIKTQPLHPTQKVISEDDNECLIELYIVPNYEFIQRVLMNANGVKVFEPEWLKDEVLEILKLTIERYG